MQLLIDTDIAIHLRDGNAIVAQRLATDEAAPVISAITLGELQAGSADDQSTGKIRRPLLDAMLRFVPVLPFGQPEAFAYGKIVGALGYNRRQVLDRMIAAQAIVAGIPLATINGRDFRDIPDLDLLVWEVSST